MGRPTPKRPLRVAFETWAKPEDRVWFIHKGRKHKIVKLAQARTFAKDNGYAGIKIFHPGVSKV